MPQAQIRSERIETRISPDVLAMVRRAAELQGRSLSDFVVSAAERAARETITEVQGVRLSAEDGRRFVEALLSPAPPTSAMTRAHEHRRRLLGEG